MIRNINDITKEKILSLLEESNSDLFNDDKYIELKKEINILLRKHTKKIFPKNILDRYQKVKKQNEYSNYRDYIDNYLNYIRETPNLDDLWMVIGISHRYPDDIQRFKNDYDIGICQNEADINYSNEDISLLRYYYRWVWGDPIYSLLSQDSKNIYLKNKFSKIIYDWSVINHILRESIEETFNDLKYIKDLISLYGVLYIDTIDTGQPYPLRPERISGIDKYYLKFGEKKLTPKVLSEVSDITKYSYIIPGFEKNTIPLLDAMDLDGAISEKVFHNFIDQAEPEFTPFKSPEYLTLILTKLKEIFTEDKFIINHYKNSYTYPNNAIPGTPNSKIDSYYEIIRISL
jgi:hypothetical protein